MPDIFSTDVEIRIGLSCFRTWTNSMLLVKGKVVPTRLEDTNGDYRYSATIPNLGNR